MLAEDPHREDVIQETHSFDELARGMAEGTLCRRQALKLIVGALLGGSLLALLPGTAGANVEQHVGGGGGKHRHRHRHHRSGGQGASCSPCNTTQAPPPDLCCLHATGQTSGCFVPVSVCIPGPPPPGTACTCI